MDIIDVSDPANPVVIHRWRIENSELHVGAGGKDIKYFKWNDRYYVVLSIQFRQGGPDADLGAVIFDVTGLPDVSTFKEVARIQGPQELGGFHNIYVYKHSNGRPLLFSTTSSPTAHVYDLGYVVEGRMDEAAALLGIPDDVTQAALLPVAYTKGTEFQRATRRPIQQIVYWDAWKETRP